MVLLFANKNGAIFSNGALAKNAHSGIKLFWKNGQNGNMRVGMLTHILRA